MKILTYVELVGGVMTDSSSACALKGIDLARKRGGTVDAIIVAPETADAVEELAHLGFDRVLVAKGDAFEDFSGEKYADAVEKAVRDGGYQSVFLPASTTGNSIASLLASKLKSGCVLECINISTRGEFLCGTKLEFERKVLAEYKSLKGPFVATLEESAADEVRPEAAPKEPAVIDLEVPAGDLWDRVKVISRSVVRKSAELKEARLVVGVGAGVGDSEGFGMVKELAEVLGAEMGATRAAVDAGWLGPDKQIGQTGVSVKPDLYIACGISGAVQHRVGIENARKIVAINIDPEAPIFKYAHYAIIGNLKEVVPKLVDLLKER